MKKLIAILLMLIPAITFAQEIVFDTITFVKGGSVFKLILFTDSLQINNTMYYSFKGHGADTSFWKLNGTSIYNKNTGNVGMGVTAPLEKLHVESILLKAIYGKSSNQAGVYGESNSSAGVYGYGPVGVQGSAVGSGKGVYGLSSSGNAIEGTASTSGRGVNGISVSGQGVYGTSTTGAGVYGVSSSNYGGIFQSGTGSGVSGYAGGSNGAGIYGNALNATGGYFESTNGRALYASSTNGYAAIFGTGNVGIGITNPTSKLVVVGTTQSTYFNTIRGDAPYYTTGYFWPTYVCFSQTFGGYNNQHWLAVDGGTGNLWLRSEGTAGAVSRSNPINIGDYSTYQGRVNEQIIVDPANNRFDINMTKTRLNKGTASKYLYLDANKEISYVDLPDGIGYPSAGIAVSTGSAWGPSITDNSTNWNRAYDRFTDSEDGIHVMASFGIGGSPFPTDALTVWGKSSFYNNVTMENTGETTLQIGGTAADLNHKISFWSDGSQKQSIVAANADVGEFVYTATGHIWNDGTGSPLMTLTNDGKLGLNNSSPAYTADVSGSLNVSGPSILGDTNIISIEDISAQKTFFSTTTNGFVFKSFGNPCVMSMRSMGGTPLTPTASTSGTKYSLNGGGHNGTSETLNKVAMLFTFPTTWTSTNNETAIELQTTPNGSTTKATKFTIHGLGTKTSGYQELVKITTTPTLATGMTATYTKGNYYVIAYNDAGTMKYRYFDQTATANPPVWVYSTTAP